jgi:hypothetical protein
MFQSSWTYSNDLIWIELLVVTKRIRFVTEIECHSKKGFCLEMAENMLKNLKEPNNKCSDRTLWLPIGSRFAHSDVPFAMPNRVGYSDGIQRANAYLSQKHDTKLNTNNIIDTSIGFKRPSDPLNSPLKAALCYVAFVSGIQHTRMRARLLLRALNCYDWTFAAEWPHGAMRFARGWPYSLTLSSSALCCNAVLRVNGSWIYRFSKTVFVNLCIGPWHLTGFQSYWVWCSPLSIYFRSEATQTIHRNSGWPAVGPGS